MPILVGEGHVAGVGRGGCTSVSSAHVITNAMVPTFISIYSLCDPHRVFWGVITSNLNTLQPPCCTSALSKGILASSILRLQFLRNYIMSIKKNPTHSHLFERHGCLEVEKNFLNEILLLMLMENNREASFTPVCGVSSVRKGGWKGKVRGVGRIRVCKKGVCTRV